MRARELSH
jgi:hypothetical protein